MSIGRWVVGIVMAGCVWVSPGGATEPTVLFREDFDDDRLLQRGWYDGQRFKISAEAYSGTGCIEYHWNPRTTSPDSSSGMRHLFEPTDTVYVSFFIRLSKDWMWTRRPYHPHLMHFMTTENGEYHGPAASHLTLYIEPQNGKLRLAAQDIQNKDAKHGLTQGPLRGGYNGKFYDSQKPLFTDDKWHCVEAFFKLNSLDLAHDKPNADGIVRAWFDGKRVVDFSVRRGNRESEDRWASVRQRALKPQVIGSTDRNAAEVVERPISVEDLLATVCTLLGIDFTRQNLAPGVERPIPIVDTSKAMTVLSELL